jgi:hypothetical protein
VDSIRVALIDMPRLLNQLVEAAIVRQPGVELVANVREPNALRPDADPGFIVGSDGIGDAEIASLLATLPLARIMIIREHGGSASLDGVLLGELSPEQLVAVIRNEAAR